MRQNDRAVLLRTIVAIAWADGRIATAEREQVRRMAMFLRLGDEALAEAEAMLDGPGPGPDLPRPEELPAYEVRLYVFQQALSMAYADGYVDPKELRSLEAVAEALKLEEQHVETAWRRAKEMSRA